MVSDSTQKYWFKTKKYGYGWGLPQTWQGWLVMAIYLLVVFWNLSTIGPRSGSFLEAITQISPTLFATVALLIICYKTGEKPRWRWGN
jgi:hypothetical protein